MACMVLIIFLGLPSVSPPGYSFAGSSSIGLPVALGGDSLDIGPAELMGPANNRPVRPPAGKAVLLNDRRHQASGGGQAAVASKPADKAVSAGLIPQEDQLRQGAVFTNSLGMAFVYIGPGTFMMGSPSFEPYRNLDEVRHRVTLTKGYWMQTTEVTQGQWKAVMGSNPSYFINCGSDCPVEQVSWKSAQVFIRKLNQRGDKITYSLPTESEWEHAARAGAATALYTGDVATRGKNDAPELGAIAWYGGNSCVDYPGGYDSSGWMEKQIPCAFSGTHPVGQKKPNRFGLYDMLGNVWEWCADWQGDYPPGPVTDPAGPPAGKFRMFRGGSWYNDARYCRLAYRHSYTPGSRHNYLGFRLAGR